ncbi:MAG: enoyl-CoA hydratase/isomerase family protein [Acidobacteria bacterium]|nr:enoyl-CoA hydratase/isomerase family protein [Acidobacteriota bacterium]
MSTPHVVRTQDGPIAVVTFNRPEARNAMTWPMYDALVEQCEELDRADDVRVVVLQGAGSKAFVAGTDIAQFRTFRTAEDGVRYERRIDAVVDRLERLAKPTIAAIDGVTTGGGCALAAACDLRICTTRSRFGVPIARTLGNCLSASNHARFLDLIGPARLKELLFTGRLLTASEAADAGLVNRVVEPDGLVAVVREYAQTIAANAPLTVRASKEMIRRIQEHRRIDPALGRDLIVTCYTSADFHEGVDSFLEKRAPRWTGT